MMEDEVLEPVDPEHVRGQIVDVGLQHRVTEHDAEEESEGSPEANTLGPMSERQ